MDKDNWHKGFLTLNGGSITTPLFYSIYRPGMTGNNDSDCRFGCEATVNGGLLDVAGDVRLGFNRSRNGDNLYSRLTVNAGRVAVGGKFYLLYDNTQGAFTAPGSIVLNGGEVDVKGVIDMSRNAQNPGNQAYNTKFGIWLNGGVLKAENIIVIVIIKLGKHILRTDAFIPGFGIYYQPIPKRNAVIACSHHNMAVARTFVTADDISFLYKLRIIILPQICKAFAFPPAWLYASRFPLGKVSCTMMICCLT